MSYSRSNSMKLMKHFVRVYDNTPSKGGFWYKKKGTSGPFYTRENALKKLKILKK